MITVPLNTIAPELEKLKKRLGIKLPAEHEKLAGVVKDLLHSSDARFWFKKLKVDDPAIKELLYSSKDLSKLMQGFADVFVVICTVGKLPLQVDPVIAIYFDRAGSDLCENLAQRSSEILFQRYYTDSDYELSKRYSPGYGDFDLQMQKNIFKLFDADALDVRLSESFYMEPEKSVSYIVGVKKK